MANEKISQMPAISSFATGDLLPIVDISEISTSDQNKSVTFGELFRNVLGGTASAPSIAFTGDQNTGLYSPGADQVAISTNGTQRMFAGAGGNVGIGPSTSLGARIDANTTGTDSCVIRTRNDSTSVYLDANNGYAYLNCFSNHPLLFGTNNTERARIDSSGRLLVGTSSARQSSGGLQVESTAGNSFVTITRNDSGPNAPQLSLQKSRGTANGQFTVVNSNDQLGQINFKGADGTADITAAQILSEVDGTPGTNDMPGRLVFSTTADGASSPTERMRITQAGHFGLYGTDPATEVRSLTSGYGLRLLNNSFQESAFGNSGYWIFNNTASSGTRNLITFRVQGADKGSITSDGTNTSYNTSSDYRLKENVAPLTGAIDRVNQLQVHRFNFIANPDRTVDGFIAHEAQAIVPECVTGTKDEVDADGNPVYQGIDQSKLVPLLTAALQEALQKIEDLETRLTAAGL